MLPKIHIATSRDVGVRCKKWASMFYAQSPMEDCEVFISVMYDTLLTPEFLAGRRSYNFHPGLLPQYRGSGAFSWAIINEEKETGVTLHEIDKHIDHGNIIERASFPISSDDTAETLFRTAEKKIESMFRAWLPRLIDGAYESSPQNEAEASLYLRSDLERAKDLTRYARAFTFKGKDRAHYTTHDGLKVPIVY